MTPLSQALRGSLDHLGQSPGTMPTYSCCRTSGFVPDVVLKAGRPWARSRAPRCRTGSAHGPPPPFARTSSDRVGGRRRAHGTRDRDRPGPIVTESLTALPALADGEVVADPSRDLAKIAVLRRHLGTGRIGRGLVAEFGLRAARWPQPRARRTCSSSSTWTPACAPRSSGSQSWRWDRRRRGKVPGGAAATDRQHPLRTRRLWTSCGRDPQCVAAARVDACSTHRFRR